LSDKSFWITREDGKETLCRWIHKVVLDYDANTIILRLDEDLLPFLIGVGERFTKYELFWILKMTSGYSIRIYELLKSEEWKQTPVLYKTEELKRLLGVEGKYKNNGDFVRKAVDIAVKEINNLTDMKVRYKKITKGRAITHLQFFVKEKDPVEKVEAIKANEQRRGGQLHMETPTVTAADAFPIVELAGNIKELSGEIPEKDTDCKTFEQLQAWQAKHKPKYKPGWVFKRAKELGIGD
jgi:plasmid replication initiation protein